MRLEMHIVRMPICFRELDLLWHSTLEEREEAVHNEVIKLIQEYRLEIHQAGVMPVFMLKVESGANQLIIDDEDDNLLTELNNDIKRVRKRKA